MSQKSENRKNTKKYYGLGLCIRVCVLCYVHRKCCVYVKKMVSRLEILLVEDFLVALHANLSY